MNFNANAGARHPAGPGPRKVKRVSDVNALGMGPGPTAPPSQFVPQNPMGGPVDPAYGAGVYNNVPSQQPNYGYVPQMQQQQQQQMPIGQPQQYPNQVPAAQNAGQPLPNNFNPSLPLPEQFAMFQQPIVQDMALQYGQRLADQGKQLVENQFERYVPVTKLKYYFAVDNNYVIKKLRLLFFPFIHKDWSLKYDQDNPVQPRYDINAPDLYIPTMAYITYVVVAGLMLGMQNRFTPEQLGIQASSALAYSLFELVVYSIVMYVVNISSTLRTLDLLAFSGYKFVIIVACILTSIVFHSTGYFLVLIYSWLSLGFFLLRTLKSKVLQDSQPATASAATGGISYDPYGNPQQQHLDYSAGRKRKLYFLFLIVGCQAFFSFLLSKHLILNASDALSAKM